MMIKKPLFRRFLKDIKGLAYIEFAMVLPVLLLLFAGGVELTRYTMANQKVDKAAAALSNFISQQPDPSAVNYNALMNNTIDDLIKPFDAQGSIGFVVSEVVAGNATDSNQPANPLQVSWQGSYGKAGASRVGTSGGAASAPISNMNINPAEKLVTTEVFFQYTTFVPEILDALGAFDSTKNSELDDLDGNVLYKRSVVRHRLGGTKQQQDGSVQPVNPNIPCCGYYCQGDAGTGEWQPACACKQNCAWRQQDVDNYDLCTHICPPSPPSPPSTPSPPSPPSPPVVYPPVDPNGG